MVKPSFEDKPKKINIFLVYVLKDNLSLWQSQTVLRLVMIYHFNLVIMHLKMEVLGKWSQLYNIS